jgi:hypothetical protein
VAAGAAATGGLLDGGAGNDSLSGGAGDDWLAGGAGHDALSGGAGHDTLLLDAQDSTAGISGGEGFDIAIVSPGPQQAGAGGAGLEPAGVILDLSASGIEAAIGGAGADRFSASNSTALLFGRGGDDHLTGGLGADYLDGGAGNDSLQGGAGDDHATCGSGFSPTLLGGARRRAEARPTAAARNMEQPAKQPRTIPNGRCSISPADGATALRSTHAPSVKGVKVRETHTFNGYRHARPAATVAARAQAAQRAERQAAQP